MRNANRLALCYTIVGLLCGCQSPHQKSIPSSDSAVSSSATGSLPTRASGASYNIPDALVSLNKLFLEGYRGRQAVVKTNISPLIVADFSSLVLYRNGLAETNRSIPDIYHALKAVAHAPFSIFLRVDSYADDAGTVIPDSVVAELKTCQDRITTAEASLPKCGFSEQQLTRQQEILGACEAYLKKVISARRAPRTELLSFTRRAGPWMLTNANEAAMAQLDMTHAAVMQWKKRIPSEEWKRLVVVVRGPQMPRRMNILTQYFSKVLGEPSHNLGYPLESRRLIYAEFIPKERDHLDLMATTFIDGEASEAFFGDRWRMSRDVLADGAEAYLKRLNFN